MSKGNKHRSNREPKKPKQEKPKAPVLSSVTGGRSQPVIGGAKVK